MNKRPATCIDCEWWRFTEMGQREIPVPIGKVTTQSVRYGICLNPDAEVEGHSCVTANCYRKIAEDRLACPRFREVVSE